MAQLRPDILAVQECEPLDNELFLDGDVQPTFRDRLPRDVCPGRGVALLSYGPLEIGRVATTEAQQSFRMFEAASGALCFNVVAAWTWEMNPSSESYRQIHRGLHENEAWIRRRPTVVLGDFNMNASFRSNRWPDLQNLMDEFGLVSAYHTHFQEAYGKETRPTHYFRGKETSPFHLDYCLLPSTWTRALTRVDVGTFADWHQHSDHTPLVVDLDATQLSPN